jgi:hypothetical protein
MLKLSLLKHFENGRVLNAKHDVAHLDVWVAGSHRDALSERDELTCVDDLALVSVIKSIKELLQYDSKDGNG